MLHEVAVCYAEQFWSLEEALEAGCDASISVIMGGILPPNKKEFWPLFEKCNSPAFFKAFRTKEYAHAWLRFAYLSRKGESWLHKMNSTGILRPSPRRANIARGIKVDYNYDEIDSAIAIANGHEGWLSYCQITVGALSRVCHLLTEQELCAVLERFDVASQYGCYNLMSIFQTRSMKTAVYVDRLQPYGRRLWCVASIVDPEVYRFLLAMGYKVRMCCEKGLGLDDLLSDAERFREALDGVKYLVGDEWELQVPLVLVGHLQSYLRSQGVVLVHKWADRYVIKPLLTK